MEENKTDRRVVAVAGSDPMREALLAARTVIEAESQDIGYGFYHPENPYDFHPDAESCSEDEIAAHAAACEAFDRGEDRLDKQLGWIGPNVHVLTAPWGIGSYSYRRPESVDALTKIDAALSATAPLAAPQQVDAVQAVPEDQRERLRNALSVALGEAMDCARVWSAWGVGTMSEDDFSLLADNDERLDELVDAVLAALASPSPAVPTDAQGAVLRERENALIEFYNASRHWEVVCGHPEATADDEREAETRFIAAGSAVQRTIAAAPLAQPTDTTAGE